MEEQKLKKLNMFNLIMGVLHLLQGVAVLVLSDPDRGVVSVVTSFLRFEESTRSLVPASREIFELNLAWLVAIFFFMSAAAHLFIATVYRKRYESDLTRGINRVRWYEYALSASVMMVAISLLSGIYDLSSLVMIFTLDALMNLMGLIMEKYNQKSEKVDWSAYIIGCVAGIVPWVVFGIYIFGARQYGGGDIPDFVYWIYLSIFIFFNSFAINMWLQYKKVGKWKDYLYGEKAYIILSLLAKSALAWQVFGGTLRP